MPARKDDRKAALLEKFGTSELIRSVGVLRGEFNLRGVDAHTGHLEQLVKGNVVAIGDLAFSLDPASGSGHLYAIESGWFVASELCASHHPNTAYATWMAETCAEQKALAKEEYAKVARRYPQSAFWARCLRETS